MSLPYQNNYRERLIEKLKQQIQVNGPDIPAAEELERLLNSAGDVIPQNAEGETESEEE